MKFSRQAIFFILLIITLYNFGSVIFKFRDRYTHSYWDKFNDYKYLYWNSQYSAKNTVGWVPDELLYAYAAGDYLKGGNPIIVQSTQPPLGKYFLSASVFLFNNENIAILIFFFLFSVILFILSKEILKDSLLSLLPVFFLSFEKLFLRQLENVPLLDIIQLFFIVLCLFLFTKGLKTKKISYFIFFSLSLGVIISVKFFISGIILLMALFVYSLFLKDKRVLLYMLLTLPFSFLVLFLSYFKILLLGSSLLDVFRIQKWLFYYHKSKTVYPLSVWPLIFLNRWQTWWGENKVIHEVTWQITWPMITTISLILMAKYWLKRIPKDINVEPTIIWTTAYLIFISLAQANARYLLPALPFLYLLTIWSLKIFFNLRRK